MSSFAGTLLVARPALRDGFFARSVILLLDHGPEGAFGLVLNRQAEAKELPFPIFIGGPCKMDGLLMIHGRKEWLGDDEDAAKQVCPGVYLGTTAQFEQATDSGEASSDRFRVFTGYAGWGPKQLESEMNEDAWIVLPASGEIIFDTPVPELWESLAPPSMPEPSLN